MVTIERAAAIVSLLGALSSCVSEASLEDARGRPLDCAPWARSDDLDPVGCDETLAETWRCAISAGRYRDDAGEPVGISQVCRYSAHRGRFFWAWRTYLPFPADCGSCAGTDFWIPDGCEPVEDPQRYAMPECAPVDEDAPGGAADPAPAGDELPAEDADPADPGAVAPGVVGVDGVAAFDALPARERADLRTRRLFWGHQSVGENLIEGSATLGYDWSQVSDGSDYDWASWGHGYVEDNGDPWRKIRSFSTQLRDAGIGGRVDAASFKFCWIDFEAHTDVEALLEAYQSALVDLEQRFPTIRLLHVTTPLTSDDPQANAARWQYGRRLIAEQSDAGVVLDLAAIESTDSAGRACTLGGVPRLCDEWRDDEGHLNDRGKARAARAFLYAFSRLF